MRVKDLVRHYKSGAHIDGYSKFNEKDKELNELLYDTKSLVHTALCGELVGSNIEGQWMINFFFRFCGHSKCDEALERFGKCM